MATGTLANGELANNVLENIYSIPSEDTGGYAVVSISMLNTTASDINIRIALHGTNLTDADYIEYDTTIVPKGMIERTGVVVGAGQAISLICTDSAGCVFRINGTEVNVADPAA